MLYSLGGAFVFGFGSYALCKLFGVRMGHSGGYIPFPNEGPIIVAVMTLAGFSMGFGYGSSLLIDGRHPINHLIKGMNH